MSADLNGRGAIELWRRHLAGDPCVLDEVLTYNAEDLLGLRAVRRRLHALGAL